MSGPYIIYMYTSNGPRIWLSQSNNPQNWDGPDYFVRSESCWRVPVINYGDTNV